MFNIFWDCKGLTSVTSLIEEPFPISPLVFDPAYLTATLYVPPISYNKYKETRGWNEFVNIEKINDSYSISIEVKTPDGNDISDHASITWYDETQQQLGTGTSLGGVTEGEILYYSVALDEEMGRVCHEVNMQKVEVSGETITCTLEKINRVALDGRVSAIDIDKNSLTVSVKQMLNGKWEQNYIAQTDERGLFSLEVYDDETEITISGDGYLNTTLHRDRFDGNGNMGVIPVNLISGFSIAANITMHKAVEEGGIDETTIWTDGLNNIEFTLTNTTKGNAISDFSVQNGSVIIKTGAALGDIISLTAMSKQGLFADATTTFTIVERGNEFDLQLTELGGINATCTSSNNASTVGYLYGCDDVLAARGSYIGETLSLCHLPSGVYTLVTMGNSLLLGNMTRLEDLTAVGLTKGTDYETTRVEVADGLLTTVGVNDVPKMDDTRFYYTTNNTYFSVNKSVVTAGSYLTLQAHVEFKPEYAEKADVVMMTVDLPEGCQMVNNSVIANHQSVPYTVNDNRVTMLLNKEQYESQVRFCVIPTLNQIYTITAMCSFDIDGKIQQPIGTTQIEVKGLSLSVPNWTVDTNITVNGTAKGHSEVSIYDNDVLVGKTSSKADGSWSTECELYKPYIHSFHDIYAKIMTENGLELTSETRQVEYDRNRIVPEKVTMTYYNGWYNENKTVEFNLVKGTTSPSSYPFYSGTDFTFLADFTRNDSTLIRNVNIKVLNSDGTVRILPAIFDGKLNKWVATTNYSSSSRLPQNVKIEYDYMPINSIINNEEGENDVVVNLLNFSDGMEQFVDGNYQLEIVEDNAKQCFVNCNINGLEDTYYYKVIELKYNEAVLLFDKYQFDFVFDEGSLISSCTLAYEDSVIVYGIDVATEYAVKIVFGKTVDSASHSLSRSAKKRAPGSCLAGFVERILDLADLKKYWDLSQNVPQMSDLMLSYVNSFNAIRSRIELDMYAKCKDGQFKLDQYKRVNITEDEYWVKGLEDDFIKKYDQYLLELRNIAKRSCIKDAALNILGNAIKRGAGALINRTQVCTDDLTRWFMSVNYGRRVTNLSERAASEITRQTYRNAIGIAADVAISGADNMIVSPLLFDIEGYQNRIYSWMPQQYNYIYNEYLKLVDKIHRGYNKCSKDKEEEEKKDEPVDEKSDNKHDFKGKGTIPAIDPSGYVYEAVFSNRLEGVTTTCYQKVTGDDLYGDKVEEAVVWNAADFSQQNPLKTDAKGFYRWDVPQGVWQVKYEKEGYETAYSDWLPVPPPQLDVNVGMKQNTPPTVKQMHGYESGITVELSKYMRPETMTTGNITVTRNGATEKGSIELLNAEKVPLGDETFVSKVKFVPDNRFNSTDLVVVTIHKDVESYCGVKMAADHVETVKIESEVKMIVADSVVTVPYQGERELRVLVMPKDASAGRKLHVKTSSEMIASVSANDVVIDQDGAVLLTIGGELPGGAVLDFVVDGTDVMATSKVKVVQGREIVATPVANINSGETVEGGTQIVLTCETEGATIYYTLDGSCPCDEATRHKYDGPITIDTDVIVKAIAVKDDMDDSDIATFIYIVDGINDLKITYDFNVVFYDGTLTITGADGCTVCVFDLLGRELASRRNVSSLISIGVPQAVSYIISVTTKDGKSMVQKVMGQK